MHKLASAAIVLGLAQWVVPHAAGAELPSYADPQSKSVPGVSADCGPGTSASRAIRACSELLRSDKIDPQTRMRVYTLRGYAWLKEEEPVPAISDFTLALEIDETHLNALKGRAASHEFMQRYDLAIEDWSRLVAVKPKATDYSLQRARAYHHLKKYEQAVADYTRVLKIEEKNLDALVGRAISYEGLNRFDEALADFALAIETDKKFIPAFVARGEFWERRFNTKKALADYKRAIALNSVNMKVRVAMKRLGVFWFTDAIAQPSD